MKNIFFEGMHAYDVKRIREACEHGNYFEVAAAIEEYDHRIYRMRTRAAQRHTVVLEKIPSGAEVAWAHGVVLD